MADDATGRPKPTARRRRKPRSTAPSDGQGAVKDVAPDLEPAPTTADATPEPDGSAELVAASEIAVVDIWPMPDSGPGDRVVCPFLRSIDDGGALGDPIDVPAAANRCAAQAEAVPQSLRQQDLVCLTSAHASCPRFLRGATVETDAPVERTFASSKLTPATVGALALLAAAFSASVMFTFARGGLDLPVAGAVPSASAVAVVPSLEPSVAPSVEDSLAPSATPTATASATPSTTPIATSEPSPSVTPGPTPSATPISSTTPAPTSDRYALLKACPDKPDCWIYRVRSGDNLFSIANYFGVPLATVKALNPWTVNGLRAGRDLILPPPTR